MLQKSLVSMRYFSMLLKTVGTANFFLHKFRHTLATRNLQDHVSDIKTLQNWMEPQSSGVHDGLPKGSSEKRRTGADQLKQFGYAGRFFLGSIGSSVRLCQVNN